MALQLQIALIDEGIEMLFGLMMQKTQYPGWEAVLEITK
jgi:hypothetical protein